VNVRAILFVDDEPANVAGVARTLEDALGLRCVVAVSVEEALVALHQESFDLVVADVFMPLGEEPHAGIGPRARRVREQVEHLGGLVLLDEMDRLPHPPGLISHTACTDAALLELLGARAIARVRKPAPFEVLLREVLGVVRGE